MSHIENFHLLLGDVVWPSLVLEGRLLSVIPISTGLVVEWFALAFGGFGLSWKKAIFVDLIMNAASSVIGIVLIPFAGLGWELSGGLLLEKVFNVGTFNPIAWIATFALSVAATTAIEAVVVRWAFRIPLGQRRFWILFGANTASVGIAYASLWLHPPQY